VSIDTPSPPVQPAPPRSHKDAKADAKSAKAYAKAQRSWYQKKRYIFSLGAFLLIIVIAAASGGSTDSTKTAPDDNAASAPAASQPENQPAAKATPAVASGPTAQLPIQNGDWRLDSIRVKDDGLGDFGGVARVTYTGANPAGGANLFTLTVFVGGKDVAVLNGSAEDVKPGTAETVQFISGDSFVGGPYKFDFQNDL
jgi:hypothetical protein